MPDYRRLRVAAGSLHSTKNTLIDFNRAGWINVTVRHGCQFISGKDG